VSKNLKYYLAGSIALITFLVYLAALRNSFAWDDEAYILANPHIRSLDARLLKWAFFDFYAANWHPLTWLSHAADYALWGLNPLGHHLTSVVLHALNTFIVVLLSVKLLRYGAAANNGPSFLDERAILIAAGVTGLLFGLHPVHVESAAWVAERKDVLCGLFFLLSIMRYMDYAGGVVNGADRKPRMKAYLAALGFFTLALLSKPMAVTLPVVLLILDWYPLGRVRSLTAFRSSCVEKLPFITLSFLSSILTILAQKTAGAIQSIEFAPLSTRMLVAGKALIGYLGKMIWPLDLIPYYPYDKNISLLTALPAIALVIAITAACSIAIKKRKIWLSAWTYYVVTLVPVIGIVQVGGQSMADRYTYLPGLGPFLVFGVGAAWIGGRIFNERSRSVAGISAALGALLLVSSIYLTVNQIRIWKSEIDVWNCVIEKEPGRVPQAYYNRGTAFGKTGRYERAIEDLDEAIALSPSYYEAYNNRGIVFSMMGLFDKAIESFNQSISLNPNLAEPHANRGLAYFLSKQYDRALTDFNRGIELDRNYPLSYYNRGKLYSGTGDRELAISDFRKACDLGYQNACESL
jgi:hypothetical protein